MSDRCSVVIVKGLGVTTNAVVIKKKKPKRLNGHKLSCPVPSRNHLVIYFVVGFFIITIECFNPGTNVKANVNRGNKF